MHSADTCATCRDLTAPYVVVRTFIIVNMTMVTVSGGAAEVTGDLFKCGLQGTTIPAGACQCASSKYSVEPTAQVLPQSHAAGGRSVSEGRCTLKMDKRADPRLAC
jgi:hypothetical protein